MATENIKGKTVVFGLGRTGISSVRFLVENGIEVTAVDDQVNPVKFKSFIEEFPSVPLCLGKYSTTEVLAGASSLLVSPGITLEHPLVKSAVERRIRLTSDIELFTNKVLAPVIAITGSNGKSTVTTLVGELIKQSGYRVGVGGNLGTPALELLSSSADFYVLELSSFQLDLLGLDSVSFEVSTVLNISEDHLDRHRSFGDYLAAKRRIYHNCQAALINLEEPVSYRDLKLPKTTVSFGRGGDFEIVDGNILAYNKPLVSLDCFKLQGLHNAKNALAALAIGSIIGLPESEMVSALLSFSGLDHRCQIIGNLNGVKWYDDSKGTNVGATIAAVSGLGEQLKGKLILIAGGIGKGADFSKLAEVVGRYVKALVLIGRDRLMIAKQLESACQFFYASSMKEAVSIAANLAKPEDAVLLSPACASFDMFDNFEHRGKVFRAEYEALVKKGDEVY
jgi:UDP-N-acetylmuramoylalanine--D-glutamate ligase